MKKSPKEEILDFRIYIEQLAQKHDAYKTFAGFCTLAACALAAQTREAEYLEEAKRWTKEELLTFSKALAALVNEMNSHPFTDLLGGFYMDFAVSHKCKQWGGEFHTPKPICDLMAQLISGDNALPEQGTITLLEPACGSGAMVLAYAHQLEPEQLPRLRVTAMDIKKVCCDMCFINTTLWGIPTEIIHGNALSNEIFAGWKNIHWIFRGHLRVFASIPANGTEAPTELTEEQPVSRPIEHSAILAAAAAEQGQKLAPEIIAKIKAATQQQEFYFRGCPS